MQIYAFFRKRKQKKIQQGKITPSGTTTTRFFKTTKQPSGRIFFNRKRCISFHLFTQTGSYKERPEKHPLIFKYLQQQFIFQCFAKDINKQLARLQPPIDLSTKKGKKDMKTTNRGPHINKLIFDCLINSSCNFSLLLFTAAILG